MANFTHLHVHTEFSFLDGMAKIKSVTKRAKELGQTALAITDHGNMYGAVAFFDACKSVGIKPIIGTEFYTCDDMNFRGKVVSDDADQGYKDRRHLVLLVKDETGYKNLSMLNSIAFKHMYYKPRIQLDVLKEYHEGLICLSACLGGDIPQAILRRDFKKAEELVVFFKDIFGDDFYLELQNHGLEDQAYVNSHLKALAKKFNVKTVVTNDVHYINKDDADAQDVLMCVQTSVNIDTPNRMKMPCNEFYLKSYDEMLALFPDDLDAIEATNEIADKCNFSFVYGQYKFPHYIPENGQTPMEFIRSLIDEGIKRKYGEETKEIRDRIEMELGVISKQGFIEYYLIVWDYIFNARKMGISVGPGRGSGAGSIVAYLIDITDIDPLKYGLYFERFLNSERVSAPDFDVDFEDSRRQEVIDYVKRKYGEETVAKIITFGTMAAKNAIKDIGRVLHVPYAELDKVTKAIPNKVQKGSHTIDIGRPNILEKVFGFYKPSGKELEQNPWLTSESYAVPELVEIYNENPEIKRVIDYAIKLEDAPRQSGVHACGVIIGADVLDRHMPLSVGKEKDVTTQYTGVELEHLGFLKMDFLGLRNLSDIKLAIEYVKENHGVDVVFDRNGYDDPKVYDLISSGNTTAIFQIESSGFKDFLSRLKPTCLEDIIAAVSLYRPGPMDSIGKFIENKHNPHKIKYAHPMLIPILEQTYGCIVYQEQVMRIVQDLAGYTLGQADNVRRMMGKKKVAEMIKEEATFINGKPEEVKDGKVIPAIDGCIKRGVPEDVAKQIWNEMKDFAKYAFNKSHAAAYSLVTYQTAYLKTYYRAEFITAVLNNRITDIDEITNYVTYAKEEKIPVLAPDVNESKTYFSVKNGKIRFGLAAVKGVGVAVIDEIIKERESGGDFTSFEDFALRSVQYVNKRLVENLIYAGAFDRFNVPRSKLIGVYEEALDKAQALYKEKESDQISLFGTLIEEPKTLTLLYPNVKEYDQKTKLINEKNVLGVYVSGHPLDDYKERLSNYTFSTRRLLSKEEQPDGEVVYTDVSDGDSIVMGGILASSKKLATKSGQFMSVLNVEDLYGSIECVMFPKVHEKFYNKLEVDSIVEIKGKLQIRDGRAPSVVIDSVTPFNEETQVQNVKTEEVSPKKECLGLKIESAVLNEVLETLEAYPGDVDVYIKCDGKALKASVKVRKCNGLFSELVSIISEEDIIFFEK
ncbi:MAG: DNA polymerase III subunit alpha [Clostridia bacterium]|nr:DNA polymerase III subunit alpha [Clostridia bacterium]